MWYCSPRLGGVRVTLLPNPSHLEAVNPVAAGAVRAKHLAAGSGEYGPGRMGDTALCVQVTLRQLSYVFK